MATTKNTAPEAAVSAAPDPFERVSIKLPRESGKDEYQYVSVNDYTANIKRGETVKVPRFVADELNRSEHAEEIFHGTVDRLLEQARS